MVSTRVLALLGLASLATAASHVCIGAETGRPMDIAPTLMNDDYCDCADGSDEPETAACSHVLAARHECRNHGLLPLAIHTSHVHDGVCDCCDGSDEAPGVCADTCADAIAAARAAANARLDAVASGYAARQARLEAIAQAEADKKMAIVSQRALKEELRQLALKVTVFKDREERTEYAMRVAAAKTKGDTAQCALGDKTTDAAPATDAVEDVAAPQPDATAEATDGTVELTQLRAKDKLSLTVARADGRQMSLSAYMRDVLDEAKRIPMRSVYQRRKEDFLGPLFNGDVQDRARMLTYGLQGIGLLLSPVRAAYEVAAFATIAWLRFVDAATPQLLLDPWHAFLELLDLDWRYHKSLFLRRLSQGRLFWWRYYASWVLETLWEAPVDVIWETFFPTLDHSVVLPEADSLRTILAEIQADVAAIDQEIDRLERVESVEAGPDDGYQILKGTCAEAQIEKYVYKVCPFGEATQDSVSLGRWKRWSASEPPTMAFEDGQKCWNGPHRSVQLILECGAEDKILSVDELSTCVYTIPFATPAACTSVLLAEAQADAAKWLSAP
ncbi:glucosidase 2 subunit beta [Achlya hypogyna]|uniref:Glucosidase 2 subunit beta n=1 Tax=Achlya hypogyna TaxID=1202772 RepID=A0A1V9YDJ7_ACHHY|nr:glucosidase 2 subunit beta [Achlya hypogyna]